MIPHHRTVPHNNTIRGPFLPLQPSLSRTSGHIDRSLTSLVASVVSDSDDDFENADDTWHRNQRQHHHCHTRAANTGLTIDCDDGIDDDEKQSSGSVEVADHHQLPEDDQQLMGSRPFDMHIPYAQLRSPGPYPQGVSLINREMYLSDEDFVNVFRMSKDEFSALPKWRQTRHRKVLRLF
jgi:Villin headpiece domain